MLSNTDRPHRTALLKGGVNMSLEKRMENDKMNQCCLLTHFTIDENLSSMMIISEAFLATSVPLMPIDKPTSAAFTAGPSLVPSPVTPTTSPTPSLLAAHCH